MAAALGTAIAIALVRFRFRFRTGLTVLLFLPMATPEVVLGSGLGSQFLNIGVDKGIATTIIVPHHVLHQLRGDHGACAGGQPRPGDRGGGPRPVRDARAGLVADHLPAAAARDRRGGAAVVRAQLRRLHHHGVRLAASFETFPKYIYTAAVRAIPAQANVFASIIFLLAIVRGAGQPAQRGGATSRAWLARAERRAVAGGRPSCTA